MQYLKKKKTKTNFKKLEIGILKKKKKQQNI